MPGFKPDAETQKHFQWINTDTLATVEMIYNYRQCSGGISCFKTVGSVSLPCVFFVEEILFNVTDRMVK